MTKTDLKEIFYAIREEVDRINRDDELEWFHTQLYMIAQECCYGLSKSELTSLRYAAKDILEDRSYDYVS